MGSDGSGREGERATGTRQREMEEVIKKEGWDNHREQIGERLRRGKGGRERLDRSLIQRGDLER